MITGAGAGEGDSTIDLAEAARRLGVHYMTAYRYVRTGRLPAVHQGNGWRVTAADVAALRVGRTSLATRGHADATAYRTQMATTLMSGDEPGTWRIVEAALSGGATAQRVLLKILAPAMRDVGEGWTGGSVTVGDEHRATAVAIRIVSRLGPMCTRPGRPRGTVIVACAAGETHTLPGAILATSLRGDGYDVMELGSNTPISALQAAASHSGSQLRAICISVSADENLAAAAEAATALRTAQVAAQILIGGAAVTSLAHAHDLGADAWAADAEGVALTLIASAGPNKGER